MSSLTVEKKAANKNGVKRMVFSLLSLLLSIALWVFLLTKVSAHFAWVDIVLRVLSLFMSLRIYGQNKTSSMKMPWIFLILAFPLFGLFLYVLVGSSAHTKKMKMSFAEANALLLPKLPKHTEELNELRSADPAAGNIAFYIAKNNRYPIYNDSAVEYYSEAVYGLEAQLEELKKAEKFIFMEYHAIENAESWARIQTVLEDRVAAGVEVRVFYDDMGSIGFVNTDFAKALESKGIRCHVFNPFKFGLNMFLNNRDHRKITIIDGKVGFTGGYNLANEYFNISSPYGKWKDTGIRITGPAVRSLTVTFLEMWIASNNGKDDEYDVDRYLPEIPAADNAEGYVMPYSVNPLYGKHVGEDVYISMLDKATDYCWFCTPYLILSDEMTKAMSLAARRGVDVRIITPGIPDKKLVYKVTRSFYPPLTKNGVRIYEWSPGFTHAKMSLADDKMATCGTINLDYRSLYHHFENGCFFYSGKAVGDMKADFEHTFSQSREVTEVYRDGKPGLSILQLVLRLFAELL